MQFYQLKSLILVAVIVAMMQLTGCASNWDIVRDGQKTASVSRLNKPFGKNAYVYLSDRSGNNGISGTDEKSLHQSYAKLGTSSFFNNIKQQFAETRAFNDVREYNSATTVGPGDILIRATTSDYLNSEDGASIDWRIAIAVSAGMGVGVSLALVNPNDVGGIVAAALLVVPISYFFPTNYIYSEDTYPYIRYFEIDLLRSDGVELATFISRQSMKLERQSWAGMANYDGHAKMNEEAGNHAATDLISQFEADSKTVAFIRNQEQEMNKIYRSDVFRLMNFQMVEGSRLERQSIIDGLLSQDDQARQTDIQSTIESRERILNAISKAAQTAQSQLAENAAGGVSNTTSGSSNGASSGAPMSNQAMQAAANACGNVQAVLEYKNQEAKGSINISGSYRAAAAIYQCYIDHQLYGGNTGLTRQGLEKLRDENLKLAGELKK